MAKGVQCAVLALGVIGGTFAAFPGHSAQLKVDVPETGCESQYTAPQLKSMIEDRDVNAQARLDQDYYGFKAAMLVHTSVDVAYKVLTDYAVYKKLVPYIDRTDFDPSTKRLILEGGIWKFRLSSLIEFSETPGKLVRYRIIAGHFAGLTGEMRFEGKGEKGVLVCFKGGVSGTQWPPRFVIERGAEIVFGFTAKRMRSYMESQEEQGTNDARDAMKATNREKGASPYDSKDSKSIPQPRKRIN